MPVGDHALLSASSAHRWLYCPMLPRLEVAYPSRDTIYTREGTCAHELSEIKLQYKSGKIKKREFNKKLKDFKESADFYNEEMEEMIQTLSWNISTATRTRTWSWRSALTLVIGCQMASGLLTL